MLRRDVAYFTLVSPPGQHARFRPLRLIVDETSQEDAVHLLVVGLWYQGLVLPLAFESVLSAGPFGAPR